MIGGKTRIWTMAMVVALLVSAQAARAQELDLGQPKAGSANDVAPPAGNAPALERDRAVRPLVVPDHRQDLDRQRRAREQRLRESRRATREGARTWSVIELPERGAGGETVRRDGIRDRTTFQDRRGSAGENSERRSSGHGSTYRRLGD